MSVDDIGGTTDRRFGRVLITGGSGYLGAYLARTLLAQGREVLGVDVAAPGPAAMFVLGDQAPRYRVDRATVEDWGALTEMVAGFRPDVVVHGAAIVDTGWLRTHPQAAARVNFGGTLNVLEAARQHGVARVLLVSSIGVLPTVRQDPIRPDHPLILESEGSGSGFYGAAKVASEAFGFAYQSGFGLDFRVVRPSAPYGLGMGWPMFVKTMVEGAVHGKPVRFATGGAYPRAYTHVEDVTSLLAAVLDAPDDADRVFYASNGGPLVTASRVAQLVREVVPGADIEIGDEFGESDRFELNIRGVLSIENAQRQLGWSPRYADMRDGIVEYVDRYRAFLNIGGPT